MIGVLKKGARRRRQYEEHLYEIAGEELLNGKQRKGLWLKALSEANFDESNAKAIYLRLRVQALDDELAEKAELTAKKPDVSTQNVPVSQVSERNTNGRTSGQTSVGKKRDSQRRRVPAFVRFFSWLMIGIFGFQILDYLFFGKDLTLSPLRFIANIYFTFSTLTISVGVAAMQLAKLVFFLFCIYRAFRVRKHHKAEKMRVAT